jgi:GH15 family glucan-1,4-alpha-glucosidase
MTNTANNTGLLIKQSIEIILNNQSEQGAYVACPNFSSYLYCWFRDSSFIAYAMDLYGQFESSRRFHAWVAKSVNQRQELVKQALEKAAKNLPLSDADVLHCRYTLDSKEATGEEWQNFQLDGFGTWLWALNQHRLLTQAELPADWLLAADLVADYLEGLWQLPCSDCWEEFQEYQHPHSLAAIYGGLAAHTELRGVDHQSVLQAIRTTIFEKFVYQEHFVKFPNQTAVDASLLGLSTPYRVVEPGHPLMRNTITQMENELLRGGGLHRYAKDTYYGGGEWILLTAWLGWYYCEIGETDKAQNLFQWVEKQADSQGWLPEQVAKTLNEPGSLKVWEDRWGKIATPLLWSQAKYLILCKVLKKN